MTPGGYARKPGEDDEESMAYKYSNAELDNFFGTPLLKDMIHVHYLNYTAYIVRRDNAHPTKNALFVQPDCSHAYSVWTKVNFILKQNLSRENLIKKMQHFNRFCSRYSRIYAENAPQPTLKPTWPNRPEAAAYGTERV